MDLVLKGGTVATATDIYTADVAIQGGSIAVIGQDLRGDRVLDVTGKFVFSGAVDPHTHLELEFMDTVSSDDFYTGTVAAACGGTTTIIDFAEQMSGGTLGQVRATSDHTYQALPRADQADGVGSNDPRLRTPGVSDHLSFRLCSLLSCCQGLVA